MQIDTTTQPKKNDLVLIQGTITVDRVEPYRVVEVKETLDGTEIILNKRRNVWFNWESYMTGKSWVADCRVVFP